MFFLKIYKGLTYLTWKIAQNFKKNFVFQPEAFKIPFPLCVYSPLIFSYISFSFKEKRLFSFFSKTSAWGLTQAVTLLSKKKFSQGFGITQNI